MIDYELIVEVSALLEQKKLTISTAESCTAGALGWALTVCAGSTAWYVGGINSYSNRIKTEILKVPLKCIEEAGAVSGIVAQTMAENVKNIMRTSLGLAITGIAGPNGGSDEKPVGTVWFGIADEQEVETIKQCFAGDRSEVRDQAVNYALKMIKKNCC